MDGAVEHAVQPEAAGGVIQSYLLRLPRGISMKAMISSVVPASAIEVSWPTAPAGEFRERYHQPGEVTGGSPPAGSRRGPL